MAVFTPSWYWGSWDDDTAKVGVPNHCDLQGPIDGNTLIYFPEAYINVTNTTLALSELNTNLTSQADTPVNVTVPQFLSAADMLKNQTLNVSALNPAQYNPAYLATQCSNSHISSGASLQTQLSAGALLSGFLGAWALRQLLDD